MSPVDCRQASPTGMGARQDMAAASGMAGGAIQTLPIVQTAAGPVTQPSAPGGGTVKKHNPLAENFTYEHAQGRHILPTTHEGWNLMRNFYLSALVIVGVAQNTRSAGNSAGRG